jgi:hypothetical protein
MMIIEGEAMGIWGFTVYFFFFGIRFQFIIIKMKIKNTRKIDKKEETVKERKKKGTLTALWINFMCIGSCITFLKLLYQITIKLVDQNKTNLFSHSSGSQKSTTAMPTGPHSL